MTYCFTAQKALSKKTKTYTATAPYLKGSSWAEVGGVHEKYVNKKNVKNINFSEKA